MSDRQTGFREFFVFLAEERKFRFGDDDLGSRIRWIIMSIDRLYLCESWFDSILFLFQTMNDDISLILLIRRKFLLVKLMVVYF